jgi:hypothetical protein
MKIIPSAEEFGEAINRPGSLERAAAIMKFFSDPENFKETNRLIREHMESPTPLLKYFREK